MGNRCPDCNKFVALEHGEPELWDLNIDEDGRISADVRLHLDCSDCGNELNEASIQVEEIDVAVEDHIRAHQDQDEPYTLEIEEDDVSADDRFNIVDRHGKPIKRMRYQAHYYSFTITATVKCSCGEEFEVELSGEEQASGFEQLY